MTLGNKHSILALSFVLVTNASHLVSITNIDDLIDYIIVSITNVYKSQLSLFFLSNASDLAPIENSTTIVLSNNSSI